MKVRLVNTDARMCRFMGGENLMVKGQWPGLAGRRCSLAFGVCADNKQWVMMAEFPADARWRKTASRFQAKRFFDRGKETCIYEHAGGDLGSPEWHECW